jgi:hypothetical protein
MGPSADGECHPASLRIALHPICFKSSVFTIAGEGLPLGLLPRHFKVPYHRYIRKLRESFKIFLILSVIEFFCVLIVFHVFLQDAILPYQSLFEIQQDSQYL